MSLDRQSISRSLVIFTIDRALVEWIAKVESHIDRGAFTQEEVTEAVYGHPDFEDAWDEHLRDDS